MSAQGSAGRQEQIRTMQCLAPVSRRDRRVCVRVYSCGQKSYIHRHKCHHGHESHDNVGLSVISLSCSFSGGK